MHRVWQNLRFALRQWRKTPGLAITCVLTLALGVGANTAVFSVMNAVLLRSLPVSDPARVFYLNTSGMPQNTVNTGNSNTSFSYLVYQELGRQKSVFSDVIAYVPLSADKIPVRIGTEPEEAEADMVSGGFFSGLGVKMERGRGFSAADERNHTPTVVLSYAYWDRRFGRDPGVIGRTMTVKGVPVTIVGIAAQGFEGVEAGSSTDFWIPLQRRAELNAWGHPASKDGKTYIDQPGWWCIRMLARLAPGVSKAQAVNRVQGIFQSAAYEQGGQPQKGEKPPVLSLHEAKSFPGYDEYYGKPLEVLMSMVGLVLLIALSNVAMLLMARNSTRLREFSLRLALGAARGQIFRQLLTESLLVVAAGGIAAWGFAELATRALGNWAQIETSMAPDATVLLFTLGILILAALAFGLAPLKTAVSSGPGLVLKTSVATANTDRDKSRTSRTVIALQMALCLTLLAGAGLLVRTLHNLQTIPLGMKTDELVVFGLNPQTTHSDTEARAFYGQVLRRLRMLPGVRAVSLAENRPGTGWSNNSSGVTVDGARPKPDVMVRSNTVAPDFFHTLGIPLVAGRDFTDADDAGHPMVVIVNETFRNTFFPKSNPLGHHLGSGADAAEIVGVAKDSKYTSIDESPIPMAWVLYTQVGGVGEMHIEMRVSGPHPLAVLPLAQKAISSIDPNLPLQQPMTQQEQFEVSISQQALFARLAGFFGLIAVVLVSTGLYGAMAYRVSRRTMEIGVRMALGAQRQQVVCMILRESLVLAALGTVLGVPLAIGVSKLLSAQLYGITPYNLATYTGAVIGLGVVAVAATLLPARRAATVDPLRALRSE
ncbi:ABC transporter permease [Silvibacterium sp.]|uniref:ABC transporter permease n=1 Tax=Silvibacterium sp. TaxID=1964179 RepID=UPI0039E70BFB